MSHKILVAQGGGPTAVINQSLAGVALRRGGFQISHVYGARHGVRGIVDENLVDLGQETRPTSKRSPRRPRLRSARPATNPTSNIAGRYSGSSRPTRSNVPLYRRQRFFGYDAHRRRRSEKGGHA